MNTNQYTQKTLEALQAAQQLAVEYQHNALEPEHLLHALASQEQGLIPQLLQKLNVDPGSFAAAVAEKLSALPRVSGSGREQGKIYVAQDVDKCLNTAESIAMAKEAKEAGADGILLMPPHMWLRFGMNPNAPFEYVKDVAEGADIDIIIHLYPATSKAFYPVETLIKMCKEIDHVKCIKMGTRVTSIYEHDVRLLRQECPDISLITCHDETLCVSWFPGMDGALIGFAGCVPELICPAWDVFKNPDKHTLKEAQDWSNRIYHISQAIYGGGQPSGEAHARLKEALKQRGIFTSALMRKPVLPLNQEEKDWVALGLERSQLPAVDMEQYK